VDESALTGESHNVEKNARVLNKKSLSIAEQTNILFKGTTVASGRAKAIVCKIGAKTELGKIASIVGEDKKELSPLEKNLNKVGKIITVAVLLVAVATFLLELFLKPEQSLTEKFLIAVALCVAAIPESLPAVMTVIMSIGIWNLAKENVIVKKMQAVETLGSCDIICSDKTGTITQNKMTVSQAYFSNSFQPAVGINKNHDFEKLIHAAVLCNDTKFSNSTMLGDSTETALVSFANEYGFDKQILDEKFERVGEISFNSNRKLMTTLHKADGNLQLYSKGAVDSVLKVCSHILLNGEVVKLTKELEAEILSANKEFGSNALRVLAFAYKSLEVADVENKNCWEEKMIFCGLVGMIDPPRPEVFAAIEKCKSAGIRPVMITGDHSITAFAIAREVGIANSYEQILTGAEIDKMSDELFLQKLKTVNVFARVSPENKVRIVEGFKTLGNVTAMTGDGVNDAPSIKKASIGVGMGITGTEVTKEVADIVIADDNFATIVLAVEQGRRIFSNIEKTIRFLFSANLGEIIAIFFANIIFPHFVFLLPIQILFVNLITDTLPSLAMSFEKGEKDLMKSKKKQNLFSKFNNLTMISAGIFQALLVLGSFAAGLHLSDGDGRVASTMAFITLNLIQLFFIFSAKFNSFLIKNNPFENKWQNLAFMAGLIMLLFVTVTPVRNVMKFTLLSGYQWFVCVILALAIIPLAEVAKTILLNMKSKEKNKKSNNRINEAA
jgi:Ca2+-transporting ATPase